MDSITAATRNITLSAPKHQKISKIEIHQALHRIRPRDTYNITIHAEREKNNPFPGVDMNIGWNRARAELRMHFAESLGEVEERLKIRADFNCFDMWRQKEAIMITDVDVVNKFEKLFVGGRHGNGVWKRVPGAWWAARKGVFSEDHKYDFWEGVDKHANMIQEKVVEWWEDYVGGEGDLKRVWCLGESDEDITPARKKLKRAVRKSEEVMGEAWRARRRAQEVRGRRWTDGTVRMNRLWEEFYWVEGIKWDGKFGGLFQ